MVFSIVTLDKLRIDDPVGAISVHGVVGIWGLLAVPLSNADASYGAQLLGIVSIFGWVFIASLVVWFILKAIMASVSAKRKSTKGLTWPSAAWKPTPSSPVARNKIKTPGGKHASRVFFRLRRYARPFDYGYTDATGFSADLSAGAPWDYHRS